MLNPARILLKSFLSIKYLLFKVTFVIFPWRHTHITRCCCTSKQGAMSNQLILLDSRESMSKEMRQIAFSPDKLPANQGDGFIPVRGAAIIPCQAGRYRNRLSEDFKELHRRSFAGIWKSERTLIAAHLSCSVITLPEELKDNPALVSSISASTIG